MGDIPDTLPTPKSIASYVKKNLGKAKMAPMSHTHTVSTREVDYKGHHIVIKTTYEIDVDGHAVTGHIDVSNEGQIAYHGIPNVSFDSAVDLVKSLIDHFPDDFQPGAKPDKGGMSGMSGMPGMKGMSGMKGMAAPKKATTGKAAPKKAAKAPTAKKKK